MKKLLLLLIITGLNLMAFTQTPKTADIYKTERSQIVLDTIIDTIWNSPYIAKNNLDRIFYGEEGGITGPEDQSAYWQAVWNETGNFYFSFSY